MAIRILWADEDRDYVQATAEDLTLAFRTREDAAELNFEYVANAKELAERVLGGNYGIIFIDSCLPDGAGQSVGSIDAIKQIRERELQERKSGMQRRGQIPIYLVSNTNDYAHAAIGAGATGYVRKDDRSGLEAAIDKVIRK